MNILYLRASLNLFGMLLSVIGLCFVSKAMRERDNFPQARRLVRLSILLTGGGVLSTGLSMAIYLLWG